MASDVDNHTQHVRDKGKGPAPNVEAIHEPTIDLPCSETCVICLDRISEKAIALPCKHDQFDFLCLGTWVQQSQVCPLCKTEVRAIKYDVKHEETGGKIYYLPAQEIPRRQTIQDTHQQRAQAHGNRPYSRGPRQARGQRGWGQQQNVPSREDVALDFRKRVYRKQMYSAYIGTNRISQYRNVTPQSFSTNADLVNRAKMFIRRELRVFDFLNPSTASFNANKDPRANNAEFLLEYIVGILKSMDLKGPSGQAEELLKDFLGRDNSKLFLHELEAWLRSPYERLGDWDRHAQYGNVLEVGESSRIS